MPRPGRRVLFGFGRDLLDLLFACLFGGERYGARLEFHRERQKSGHYGVVLVDHPFGQPAALRCLLAEVVRCFHADPPLAGRCIPCPERPAMSAGSSRTTGPTPCLQGMVGKDEHTVAFLRMAASQMRDLADYAPEIA